MMVLVYVGWRVFMLKGEKRLVVLRAAGRGNLKCVDERVVCCKLRLR